jgi:hypothetical protein
MWTQCRDMDTVHNSVAMLNENHDTHAQLIHVNIYWMIKDLCFFQPLVVLIPSGEASR